MVVLLRAEAIPLGHDPELRADTSVPHWSSAQLASFFVQLFQVAQCMNNATFHSKRICSG
jgi:hypothetical protein